MPQEKSNASGHSKPKALIAVMGQTGTGKSTFINLATQSKTKLRVGHSVESCTASVDVAPSFYLDGFEVILHDTPGFNDTNLSDYDILQIISAALENLYHKGVTLHGIIYTHNISETRVGGIQKSNFGIFRELCGDTTLKNVVIVTNMWRKISSKEEGEKKVHELETLDKFFKPALLKGAKFMHHTPDTVESAHNIIRTILKNHPLPLKIQEELVDQRKDINKTSAGVEVDKKIAAITSMYEKKLKEQIEAAERARKKHDKETRQEQLEESKKIRESIAKLEKEKANQAELYRNLQRKLEEGRKKEAENFRKTQATLTKRIENLEGRKSRGNIPQSLCGAWYGVFMTDHTNVSVQRSAMNLTMWISGGVCQGEGNDADGKFTFRLRAVSGSTLTFEKTILGYVWTYQGVISDDFCHIKGSWSDDGRYGGIVGQFFLNRSS